MIILGKVYMNINLQDDEVMPLWHGTLQLMHMVQQ